MKRFQAARGLSVRGRSRWGTAGLTVGSDPPNRGLTQGLTVSTVRPGTNSLATGTSSGLAAAMSVPNAQRPQALEPPGLGGVRPPLNSAGNGSSAGLPALPGS